MHLSKTWVLGAALIALAACGGGDTSGTGSDASADATPDATETDGGLDGGDVIDGGDGTDGGIATDGGGSTDGGDATDGGNATDGGDGGADAAMPECTTDADCGTVANGTASCTEGRCVRSCDTDFGDCDGDGTGSDANGCETDLTSTLAHCGACGSACPELPGTSAACLAGACSYSCDSVHANCDDDLTNGCEVNLDEDPANCGACGRACSLANATATCSMGSCAVDGCDSGFGNCDGIEPNGCETDLQTNPNHCGACGRSCTSRPWAEVTGCSGGTCQYRCQPGRGDCNGDGTGSDADGCETDLTSSVDHCGACGTVCSAPSGGEALCTAGSCTSRCASGRGDCNGDGTGSDADGCETDLTSSVDHCGVCNSACNLPNTAAAVCSAGSCGVDTCAANFGDCDGDPSNGCETDLQTSSDHCGACGNACGPRPNATAAGCLGGTCQYTCNAGYADCNGDGTGSDADGCEVNLNSDPENCGTCGNRCSLGCGGGNCTPLGSLALGEAHACAIRATPRYNVSSTWGLWCWGANDQGQLGTGTRATSNRPIRIASSLRAVDAVTAGARHTCVRRHVSSWSGSFQSYCWGDDDQGQLGNGAPLQDELSPVEVTGSASSSATRRRSGPPLAGWNHTCQLRYVRARVGFTYRTVPQVICWGDDGEGQLGNDATLADQPAPVVAGELVSTSSLQSYASIQAVGSYGAFARSSSGIDYAWGRGDRQERADGSTTRTAPTGVVASQLGSFEELRGYDGFFCRRVAPLNHVVCFGRNEVGQLGRGTTSTSEPDDGNVVVDASGAPIVARSLAMGATASHACAVISDSEVACWGRGDLGQLGDGSTTNRSHAVTVTLPADADDPLRGVAVGTTATCAWNRDEAWCWGDNADGQLGIGLTGSTYATPQRVVSP